MPGTPRTVRVRERMINLTSKEFDILALLIANPKRVFTYELITDLVWKEDCDFYSRKAIHNHISSCVRNCALNRIFQTILRVSPGSAINLNIYNMSPQGVVFPLVGLLFATYILRAEYVENCEYKE